METIDRRFSAINVNSNFEQPENLSDYFCLTAPPSSKIWRKETTIDDTSAPMILTRLVHPFILAEVTVSAEFNMDWDQGGLVIFTGGLTPGRQSTNFPSTQHLQPQFLSTITQRRQRPSHILRSRHQYQLDSTQEPESSRWVKAGLEFTGGEIGLSTVVANANCAPDWSFVSTYPEMTPEEAFAMHMPSLRIKFERTGNDLWVWWRRIDNEQPATASNGYRSPEYVRMGWKKAREVVGFFRGADLKSGIWVGCYASRPMPVITDAFDDGVDGDYGWQNNGVVSDGGGSGQNNDEERNGLFVEFEDLEIL